MILSDLFENVEHQAGLELLARNIVSIFAHNRYGGIIDMLPLDFNLNHRDEIESLRITGNSYLELSECIDRKMLKKLPEKIRQFIMEWGDIEILFKHSKGKVNGFVTGAHWDKENMEIVLFVDADMKRTLEWMIIENNLTFMNIYDFLKTNFESLLIHELDHAFTDWRSNGKYQANKRSQRNIKLRNKIDTVSKWRQPKPEEIEQKNSAYYNDPIEINARFAQTVATLKPEFANSSWRSIISLLTWKMPGWREIRKPEKRRLIQRLATEYLAAQRPEPKNYDEDVRNFAQKLSKKYGVNFYMHYSTPYGGSFNVETAMGNEPMILKALPDIIRFADIRKLAITLSEKLTPFLRSHGFIANAGNAKRYDFGWQVKCYRPARKPLVK